jgi:hypothetical protein
LHDPFFGESEIDQDLHWIGQPTLIDVSVGVGRHDSAAVMQDAVNSTKRYPLPDYIAPGTLA